MDPETIFDSQVKRIHEYKRQLLNGLRIVVLYNRLRENPGLSMTPRTFFFAGKAAPAYRLAKVIIKFLNNLAGTIDGDPAVRGRLKVLFLPEYCVSLAERLIPATDVSNQISTAGYEASGTSNMKFMMNGALTIGTRDGATIEMAQEAGEENFFLFGLTADQVAGSRGWYSPQWHYDHEAETRAALDLIFSDHFSRHEPGAFAPLRDALLTAGDHYMHLADLTSYLEADRRLEQLYTDPNRMGAQGDPQRGGLGQVLQRPDDRRVRGRHLGRQAVPGLVMEPAMVHDMKEYAETSSTRRTWPPSWPRLAPSSIMRWGRHERSGCRPGIPPFPRGYRASGVLLHVTSLPSPYGIGDLGPAAFAWVDRLHQAGQRWWQALPLGPTGYGDSPYQCLSSFAGNELLISPDAPDRRRVAAAR